MSAQPFTQVAPVYEAYRQGYAPETIAAIKQRTSFGPSWAVLDVACGTGLVLREFGEAHRLVGIDLAWGMLAQAQRHDPATVLVQGVAEQLPFPDDSFDLVTVGQAIHWLKLEQFVPTVARVLKPGGWLVVLSKYPSPHEPYRSLLESTLSRFLPGQDEPFQLTQVFGAGNLLGLERAGFAHYRREVFTWQVEHRLESYLQGCATDPRVQTLTGAQRQEFLQRLEEALRPHLTPSLTFTETYFDYVLTWQFLGD